MARIGSRSSRAEGLRRALFASWLGALLVPACLVLVQGLGRTTLAAVVAFCLGWPLLFLALARDPEGRAPAGLRASGAGGALALAGALLLGIALFLLPVTLVAGGMLVASLCTVGVWAAVGPAGLPVRFLKGLAYASILVCVAGIAAELVLRLPAVVAITGGHKPGNARFENERYDRLWERNPLGMRSLHVEGSKPPGARQVLVLGDEATFGALIARTEDTWPYVLERSFADDGAHVEVVNAGQRGFTTANEAEWLERFGARFEPDLLILQFGMNDTVPSYPGLRSECSFWYYHLRPLLPGVDPYIAFRSYLYSALDAFKEHQEMRLLHPQGYLPLYEDGFQGWRQAQAGLHTIASWARARGVPVLLALFPDFEPDTLLTREGYRYASIHDKVRRAAEAEGMQVLDLFPEFAARQGPIEAWWPRPCEPLAGPKAQQVAAAAIRTRIDHDRLLAHSR